MIETVKLRAGNLLVPVEIETNNGRWYFKFGYNKVLMEEIKESFEGRKWHGYDETNPRKIWSAPITQRNKFVLEALKDKYGTNPYAKFDKPIPQEYLQYVNEQYHQLGLSPYNHQIEGTAHQAFRKQTILGFEMGTGKTLITFAMLDMLGVGVCLWVGPKSALRAVTDEMRKWKPKVRIHLVTYDELKKLVANWPTGHKAPVALVGDESVKVKTPTSQRTVAFKHIADAAREDHGDPIISLLSGAPAPKSPADWWSQCEIACPGFLREANIHLFRQRLGCIEERENSTGGVYPHLVTWLDDSRKCMVCGQFEGHTNHNSSTLNWHKFESSKNEVANLYNRMKGLVLVKLKKDCLDLPEKYYEIARCTPSENILRAAKLITAKSRRAIEALTLLRELSDGFQYHDAVVGQQKCSLCQGSKTVMEYYDPANPDEYVDQEFGQQGIKYVDHDDGTWETVQVQYQRREIPCTRCDGSGEENKIERTTHEIPCPKDDIVRDELELHLDVGRLNLYAGFTASVDRCCRIAKESDWGVIRADGRGWHGSLPDGTILENSELLTLFATGHNKYPRLCFIGQPGAAGMGVTLTASPTTAYFSNDFNGDSRIQSEDRGHRIGMDKERGGRILDIWHLPSDEYVFNNLKKKKDLQRLTMTGLQELYK